MGRPLLPLGRLRAIAWVEMMPRLKNTEQSPWWLSTVTLLVRIALVASGLRSLGVPIIGTISYQ